MNEKIITPHPRRARMEAKNQGMPTSDLCCSEIQPKVWPASVHLPQLDCAALWKWCLLKYNVITSFPLVCAQMDLTSWGFGAPKEIQTLLLMTGRSRGTSDVRERVGAGLGWFSCIHCTCGFSAGVTQSPPGTQLTAKSPIADSNIPEHLSGSHPKSPEH